MPDEKQPWEALQQEVEQEIANAPEGEAPDKQAINDWAKNADRDELIEAAMRDGDYRRKTQMLAKLSREQKAELDEKEQELAEKAKQLEAREGDFQEVDEFIEATREAIQENGVEWFANELGIDLDTDKPNDDTGDLDVESTGAQKPNKEVEALKSELGQLRQALQQMTGQQFDDKLTSTVTQKLEEYADILPDDQIDTVAQQVKQAYYASGDAQEGKPVDPHVEQFVNLAKGISESAVEKFGKRVSDRSPATREGGGGGAAEPPPKEESLPGIGEGDFTEQVTKIGLDHIAKAEEQGE